MKHKEKLTNINEEELIGKEEEKTATDNQWTSVAGSKGYVPELQEKTATNNQWTSTNKNNKE